MLRPSAIVVAMLASLVLGDGPARADGRRLQRALELYADGQLSQAMAVFQEALESGHNKPADVAVIYMHLGILRAGARDAARAEEAFLALCTIDPTAERPSGSSPVVSEPFERARQRCGMTGGLDARVEAPEKVALGRAVIATVEIEGDAGGLVRRARGSIGPAGHRHQVTASVRGTAPIELAFPEEATSRAGSVPFRIGLLDAYGSVLRTVRSSIMVVEPAQVVETTTVALAAAVVPPAPHRLVPPVEPPPPPDANDRSLLESPWFWATTGAAVLGAVVVAVVATQGSGKARIGPIEVSEQ